MENYWRMAETYWNGIPFETRWWLWLLSGVVGLVFFAYFAYRVGRYVLGHRRLHGRWYNPEEWIKVLEMLHYQQCDNRILHWEEIQALREYKTGRKKGLFDHRYG